MIRLYYSLWEKPIELKENIVNIIVLEDPKCFREFVFDLKDAIEKSQSQICLSEDYEEIHFSKHADIIFSPEGINLNSKKVLTKILKELREIAYTEKMYSKTLEIQSKWLEYMGEIIQESEVNLIYQDLDIEACLKATGIQVETDSKNFLQMICDYIDLMREVFDINIFIFINLKQFLTEKELLELYRHCNYRKALLCLCESTLKKVLEGEIITLIDCDLCQVY